MQKRNLPNRKSIRLKGWDYRSPGLYFITICTKDRQHHFGEIKDGIMGLSVPGCMAWHYWRQIPDHQLHVVLDQFVVMPDHIHGIIGIESEGKCHGKSVGTLHRNNFVGTCHGMSVRNSANKKEKAKFGNPQSKSLSMIINHFKGAITRWCNANGHEYFAWQSRFYDHIIRNEKALQNIRKYISDNPLRWQIDKENTDSNEIHERGLEYIVDMD